MGKAIRRVATFADDKSNAVKMTVDNPGLKFSGGSTESGESEDAIDVPYMDESVSIGFNSGYFLDFLQSINGKGEFRLLLNDAQSATELRPEGSGRWLDGEFSALDKAEIDKICERINTESIPEGSRQDANRFYQPARSQGDR